MRPQVVSPHAVDAEIDRQAHDVGQLSHVRLKKGDLERDATATPSGQFVGVTNHDEVSDILDDLVPAAPEHDGLVGRLGRAIPGDLHVRRHRDDPLCPCGGTKSREGAVRGQVEFDAVAATKVEDVVELLVQQRLAPKFLPGRPPNWESDPRQ